LIIPPKVNPVTADRVRRSWERTLHENSSRLCHTYATVHTQGWGHYQFPEPFYFDATYLTRPFVHYGYTMDGDVINAGGVPRCTGGVHRWVTNSKGLFTGAFVMTTVDLAPWYVPDGSDDEDANGMPPSYSIDHFFYFAGTGSKNLPYTALES
jgi:hypothetical protein